jgi:integrase
MNMTKRGYGDGGIDSKGDVHRLRYRLNKKRFTKTFRGTLTEAKKELRRLIKSGDDGEHIDPSKVTLGKWIDDWFVLLNRQQDAGEGARRRGLVSNKTIERYDQLLRGHVVPALGDRLLQSITPSMIDALYVALEKKLAVRTVSHLHSTLGACLKAAVRKGLLLNNPVARAEAPQPGEANHGIVLDKDQLRTLLQGFRSSPLFPIVAVAVNTGARKSEILGLQWSDFDPIKRTLHIQRSIEETKSHALVLKSPKTTRGNRIITIDADLAALLFAEREKLVRVHAGVADGITVDLSLMKLPASALMFPALPGYRECFSLTKLRRPTSVFKEFKRTACRLGFPELRFHDLRGSHVTALINRGIPLHTIARRCGHDVATMLKAYAKHIDLEDQKAADVIDEISMGVLKG